MVCPTTSPCHLFKRIAVVNNIRVYLDCYSCRYIQPLDPILKGHSIFTYSTSIEKGKVF